LTAFREKGSIPFFEAVDPENTKHKYVLDVSGSVHPLTLLVWDDDETNYTAGKGKIVYLNPNGSIDSSLTPPAGAFRLPDAEITKGLGILYAKHFPTEAQ